MKNQLTADVDARVERLGDLWVHVDEQVLLLGQLLVADDDPIVYPLLHRLTNDRICDVE